MRYTRGIRQALLSVMLCCPLVSFSANDHFSECGASRDEAMTNLGLALVADIRSKSSQEVSSKRFLGIELVSREDSYQQQVSSNLKLTGVRVIRQGQSYCASISKSELLETAQRYYHQTRSYQLQALPNEVRPRIRAVEQWLSDLEQVRLLGMLFKSDFPHGWQTSLQRQMKQLQDERSQLYPQAVTIRVNHRDSTILLAGRRVQSGEENYLPSGEYQYRIKTPGYCDVAGDIRLQAERDARLQVDIENYRYPTMLLATNKPAQVRFMVDGERRQSGEQFTIDRCDGDIVVVADYQNNSEDRRYRLEPGAEIDDYFRFYSRQELRQMRQLANQFNSGSRLEIKYGYSYVSDDVETLAGSEFDGLHQTKINYLFMNKWLRHGPGIMVAQAGGKYSGDILYNLGLQLTNIGEGQPLHIYGKVAFVPFVNMQLGVGYHEYVSEDGERFIHNFPEKAGDEEEAFARDFLVARLGGGLDISVSKWVGIQLYADQSFTQEKTTQAGVGLTLKMP